jgi:hypothetical protein
MSPPAAAADDGGHSSEGSAAGKSKAEKERTTKMPVADPARGKKAEKAAATLAKASRPGKAKKKKIRRVKGALPKTRPPYEEELHQLRYG